MKNKNLLYLLVCLFPLLASCKNPTLSSSIEQENNTSSTQDSLTSDSSIDNSSSVDDSSSTNNTDETKYFTGTDKRLLETYFNFKLPYVDDNYLITDNTEQYGVIAVSIEYYDMTTRDYMDFLSYCDDNYTFDEEYNDGTDVWQCYSINGYFIDICYDTYSSSSPFVYLLSFLYFSGDTPTIFLKHSEKYFTLEYPHSMATSSILLFVTRYFFATLTR